ncbi:hypothetical protein [Halomonas rhizosphaerae]|uniref:Uncharacterized protein n=1 Tax=Halomonas rhizosphaerae TaxID=3043296 RepID=A0ABT6UZW6_9GAMM|nr:hypothetical protein [Halomonas rhizosphaerae]MDI5891221.1 hypothetical protein [Halomonas rhizosphaerae]
MKCRAVLKISACLLLLPAATASANADFIVKFATSTTQGIFDDGNNNLSDGRPDGACGVGFGDVPLATDNDASSSDPGDIYASTASNGLGAAQLYTSFPTLSLLRVYFGGFGGNCPATNVYENNNGSPWGFFNGETALWIEASSFVWIDANGLAIDDGPPRPIGPILDPDSSGTLGTEIETIDFLLKSLVLKANVERNAEIATAVAGRLDGFNRSRSDYDKEARSMVSETLDRAAKAAGWCDDAIAAFRAAQDDSDALIREARRGVAQETCAAAATLAGQVRLARDVERSIGE